MYVHLIELNNFNVRTFYLIELNNFNVYTFYLIELNNNIANILLSSLINNTANVTIIY